MVFIPVIEDVSASFCGINCSSNKNLGSINQGPYKGNSWYLEVLSATLYSVDR